MRRQDFYFELPPDLIAQYPLADRGASRLMCLDGVTGALTHRHFHEISALLRPGDLLVFNDTRVIPARLFAHKATGGKVELLVERMLDDQRFLAHIKASKAPTPGCELRVPRPWQLHVVARHDALFEVELTGTTVLAMLQQIGHMPLPPYIKRDDEQADATRYQTVYAKYDGAVAAPTAGLHFSNELLANLAQQGIEMAYVTLHVGAGTFQPMRVDDVTAHVMHKEIMTVSAEVCQQVNAAKQAGRRVIAVGTTVVRSLESAARNGVLQPFNGDTAIFIYPGYRFQMIDALITNFHLPESTLLMLVSAFAGIEHVRHAYQTAIAEQYRFFSYGDAMFITPQHEAVFAKNG